MLIANGESPRPVKSRRFLPNLSRVLSWFVITYDIDDAISSIPHTPTIKRWFAMTKGIFAQRCLRKSRARGHMPVFPHWLWILGWIRSSEDILYNILGCYERFCSQEHVDDRGVQKSVSVAECKSFTTAHPCCSWQQGQRHIDVSLCSCSWCQHSLKNMCLFDMGRKQVVAHLHWLFGPEACLSETNNVDSYWKGAAFSQVLRSCLNTMVMVPSCCEAMRSTQLSTFGMELRLAHQNCAWHVWIIVIPVCADMGRHVFMVFWSCRLFQPPAHLLFVMLESSGSFPTRLEDQMLRPCAGVSWIGGAAQLHHWKALNSCVA